MDNAHEVAALTPTPDPQSLAGKLYRVIDILALNILRAKGVAVASPAPIPAAAMAAAPTAAAPAAPAASAASAAKQAGFSHGIVPQLVLALAGAGTLGACTGAQTAFTSANAQVVQAAMGVGRDQMLVGKEMICGAPYQVVANAMADDTGIGTAVPALCPAMKSVPMAPPAVTPVAAP